MLTIEKTNSFIDFENMDINTAARIISSLKNLGLFSTEVINALDFAEVALIGEATRKASLGNDLLVEVLKNYTLDKDGKVIRKEAEK